VGALKYDVANWSEANSQTRIDVSLGVAQDAITARQGIMTVNSLSAERGIFFQSDGDLESYDGTNRRAVTDWSNSADQTIRTAISVSESANDMAIYAYSPSVDSSSSGAYDGGLGVNSTSIFMCGTSLAYPTRIHNLVSVPNGYEASVTLASDSERYT